ncbi:hypothetical protein FF38_06796 [Lucilia cuprina]|uniref:Uncharacterized protein n=1 Tax=Lucilia cuprina TaxID=7375 RepID=A0A0L0C9E1_LUCCU|nr:hypothetical protein FF38_06796 [Lucilia cuprina]
MKKFSDAFEKATALQISAEPIPFWQGHLPVLFHNSLYEQRPERGLGGLNFRFSLRGSAPCLEIEVPPDCRQKIPMLPPIFYRLTLYLCLRNTNKFTQQQKYQKSIKNKQLQLNLMILLNYYSNLVANFALLQQPQNPARRGGTVESQEYQFEKTTDQCQDTYNYKKPRHVSSIMELSSRYKLQFLLILND